jgi:PAS domain-containing protein
MKKKDKSHEELKLEVEKLRAQLAEAEETLRAIRSGEVDALVVSGEKGEQVFTLKGAEQPYRILIEEMSEGAVMLAADDSILYSNKGFADMLKTPLEKL